MSHYCEKHDRDDQGDKCWACEAEHDEDLRRDRDEWRTQHENALACWYAERKTLGERIEELKAQLAATPPGEIRCAECGGTDMKPRGLCSGVLHPSPLELLKLAGVSEETMETISKWAQTVEELRTVPQEDRERADDLRESIDIFARRGVRLMVRDVPDLARKP